MLVTRLAEKSWIVIRALNKAAVLLVFTAPILFMALFAKRGKLSEKIIFGVTEIASNIHSIQKALDDAGYTTHAVIISNKFSQENQFGALSKRGSREYLPYKEDKKIKKAIEQIRIDWLLALRLLKNFHSHQVWYFVWNRTFLPLNVDLMFLKLAHKKVIMMHCGSEVRYRPLQKAIDKTFGVYTWNDTEHRAGDFLKKWYFVALSELLADHIVSHRDQATFQQIPYLYFRFPMGEIPSEESKAPSTVRILHAPSNRMIKKTDIVLEAISLLEKHSCDVEFILLENVANDAVLRQLSRSDILIDQQGTWAGRLAIEGCASRCAVIGGNNANYIGRLDSPIIQFPSRATELCEQILFLVENPLALSERQEACHRFWKNNYSPESFCSFFAKMLGDRLHPSRDYFFPLENQREVLLNAGAKGLIYILIHFLYHPKLKGSS